VQLSSSDAGAHNANGRPMRRSLGARHTAMTRNEEVTWMRATFVGRPWKHWLYTMATLATLLLADGAHYQPKR